MTRDLALVALALFTWGIGETSFLAYHTLYLESFGATAVQIGFIVAAYGFAQMAPHIPAGYLADRFGRRKVMLAAWLLGVAASLIMATANKLPIFVSGLLLYGLTLFVLAPMNSYAAAARGRFSVGRAITLISAAYNLGAIIGPVLGGFLSSRYGFQSIFQVAVGFFLLSTAIIFFIQPQPVTAPDGHTNGRQLLRNRGFLIFLLVFLLATFGMFLPQPLTPNFLKNARAVSLLDVGRLYTAAGLGFVVINLLGGYLKPRVGFILGQLCIGAFAWLLLQTREMPWYYLAFFLLGGYRMSRSLAMAYIRDLVEAARVGLAFGMAETMGSFATILAPLLAGYLYTASPGRMYAFTIWFVLAGILASLVFFTRRPAPQPASDWLSV